MSGYGLSPELLRITQEAARAGSRAAMHGWMPILKEIAKADTELSQLLDDVESGRIKVPTSSSTPDSGS